jgi:hypothetical protein
MVAVVLASIIIVGVLYTQSNQNFLPFLRYRHLSAWTPLNAYIHIGFKEGEDGSIVYGTGFGATEQQICDPWFSPTTTHVRMVDGYFSPSKSAIYSYDSTALMFKDSLVVPLRTGTVQIVFRYEKILDTTMVIITRNQGKFHIRQLAG